MLIDGLDWFLSFFDWELFWFGIMGGVGFGVYVVKMGDETSSWRDIVGWGVAVYLAFVMLANIHRFVEGDPNAWENLFTGSIRWFGFIFTIVITAGILRSCRKTWLWSKLIDRLRK